MMAKYRKKPVVIEAFQWNGKNEDLPDWFVECLKDGTARIYTDNIELSYYDEKTPFEVEFETWVEIETLEGTMRANKGDFIIKGVEGEIYPCKPHIFKKTYEKVD